MADILIVEDEKAMQDIIAEYMRKGGHTCFTADDGVDALVLLKNHPVDLMILDVMIPHLDGFFVCQTAREMSNMPIIMLTHKEYELLSFFMANPGQIFSREQLLNRIWGYDFAGTPRTLDTHMQTLQQTLGGEGRRIVTLIRSGYKFEVNS